MEYGGFPSVVLEGNTDRKKVLLSEIFTSYFEEDAKNLADFQDMSKLRDLILLLAPRVDSRIEIQKLASELSLSRETVYKYISFLDQTYFISLLPRHSASIDRQSAGSRKLFLCDAGIVNILGKVSQGQMFEQSVFQNLHNKHKLSFYIKDGKSEINFILDGVAAIEAKLPYSQRDMMSLVFRTKPLGLTEKYIAVKNYTDKPQAIFASDL